MFTPEERALLADYVTSTDEDIFAVKGMPGMVGAAYARYSRAKGGFREVLLNEFIKEGKIDPAHADHLIERILIAYGDDSVGELEGCHMSFENISMLATKEIEERRIGGSPIEQSTRYVFYDQKNERGEWRYLRHPSVLQAPFAKDYQAGMDFIFGVYAELVEPMKEYFKSLKSMEQAAYDINGDGEKEHYTDLKDEKDQKSFRVTYGFDVRSKACDALRCLLPLATLTNVGLFGNGRFYQMLISHLLTSDVPEAETIGQKTFIATSHLIKQYVRRAKRSDYVIANRLAMRQLAAKLLPEHTDSVAGSPLQVTLAPANLDADVAMLAAMLFPYTHYSFPKIVERVLQLSAAEREQIVATYIGKRQTRRDRPGRALEFGYPYTFEMVTNWGVYKDLMRHRMNSQLRQLFTTKIGFDVPEELVKAGFAARVQECVERSNALYDAMAQHDPVLAQYAVLHGHFVRWTIGMNDREAMHLTELRTVPQGHPQYRKAAQLMHQAIAERSPWRAKLMQFVDYEDYFWSRADSEARQRVKERLWEEKYKQK